MTQTKRALHITYRGQTTKVGFYEGTSDAAMERAIQRALGLADEVQLRFRDADGDIVALSAALPSGEFSSLQSWLRLAHPHRLPAQTLGLVR